MFKALKARNAPIAAAAEPEQDVPMVSLAHRQLSFILQGTDHLQKYSPHLERANEKSRFQVGLARSETYVTRR